MIWSLQMSSRELETLAIVDPISNRSAAVKVVKVQKTFGRSLIRSNAPHAQVVDVGTDRVLGRTPISVNIVTGESRTLKIMKLKYRSVLIVVKADEEIDPIRLRRRFRPIPTRAKKQAAGLDKTVRKVKAWSGDPNPKLGDGPLHRGELPKWE